MKRRHLSFGVIVVVLAAALAACSADETDDPGFVHIEEGAAETRLAQTALALSTPTDTPGPNPTPFDTPVPYVRPTDPPDMDGDTVITRVGSDEITLDEYRKRVRFDRYRLLYPIAKLAEKYGTEQLFDLTNEDNWYVSSLFTTLADSYSFGGQSHRVMIVESIAAQEARRRGIEVETLRYDAKMAEWLGLQVGDGGTLPAEFDARYAEFVAGIDTFAGMTEEEFRRIIRDQTLYDQLRFEIQQEADINAGESRVGVQVQDLIVATEAEAQTIADRLRAGEALRDIALSLGYQQANPDTERVVSAGDDTLPDAVIDMVLKAGQGAVIGPEPVTDGWYVAKVGAQVNDMITPEEIDAIRRDYFLNWVEAQMDDPAMVEDFDNWMAYTPQEPLPRDVSPLMREENMTLPADTGDPLFPNVEDPTGTPDAARD